MFSFLLSSFFSFYGAFDSLSEALAALLSSADEPAAPSPMSGLRLFSE
jgi:hypothetical protein